MRILVLDLDGRHGEALRVVLVGAGHEVWVSREVMAELDTELAAEAIVLTGPAARTIEVCRRLRARDAARPILILTEAGLVDDRVAGLRAGADDCVEAPYHASQMVARVDALARRAALVPPLPEIVEIDGSVLDLSRCVAVRDGIEIALSAREAALLRWLHRHRARAVTREEILEHVFGVSPRIETRSVDVAIATLRKKIERMPERPAIVVAVKGIGYAWGAHRA